jgi:uncharacterized membrane protein YhaH (DUF805 family)
LLEFAGVTLNPPRIDWTEFLFNASGRIGRGTFLDAIAAVVALLALYDQALGWIGHLLLGWIVHPLLFFVAACLISKRFHDTGRSGWRSAIVLCAFCLAWPHPRGVIGLMAVLVLAWTAIDLGVAPGTAGFNRFGARRSIFGP